MNNPEVSKLVETIVEEEARIIASAEAIKSAKQNAIISAIVNAVTKLMEGHPNDHELTLQIKPSGIIGVVSDGHSVELSSIGTTLTQKDLFENMPSIAAEFPKRYFHFFNLYKRDDTAKELGHSFTTQLLVTANGSQRNEKLLKSFSEKPDIPDEKLEKITYFFVRVHYSEKADLKADDENESTNHGGSAFAS